ncbi:hypothetical protein ACFL6M_07905 [Candidatus Eisenbacteria bacterium]|uniref:Histidine kinase N-terminal 7TM region domain-containing protein n=1 Tax=Eiseniibacteriota bacterium TaxID=2212470 RepID=A0ABV6YMD9_UNCEI
MEEVGVWDLIWRGIAAIITLSIFSFLYRDNSVYKFVERLWVGITTGYWTMLLFHTSFTDKVLTPIFVRHQFWYILPAVLGILMWFRLSKRYGFLARYSLAFYIGISTGVFIPLTIKTSILYQLQGTVRPIGTDWNGLMFAVAFIGVICSLSYFFFSKEHKGALGVASKIGIFTLMIGFGAGFGLTVMGRVALLGHRVSFLRDYLEDLFGAVF